MKTSERLLARLREIGVDLPQGAQLVRVHPSPAMRNAGAWSWAAFGPDGHDLRIGSQYPMSELIKAEALDVSRIGSSVTEPDAEITPTRGCRRCGKAMLTDCRICRAPYCGPCFTDHHHEGYGVSTEASW
ncbi:hypothetical protein ACFQ6B_23715 [Streptomyces wedmorensis]|uniref:Uncharacterized protein n=1 Tax=Streptomyces wedmorensis TaxID=43759 RepID=A0ABW6J6L8_STRWE